MIRIVRDDKKEVLFSVTKKDLDLQFFRAGGKGGQKQNKTSSACRITHKASGAVGECRNFRSQIANKKEAFRRLVDSEKFKKWVRIAASHSAAERQEIEQMLEKRVDEMMKSENMKIEYAESFGEK